MRRYTITVGSTEHVVDVDERSSEEFDVVVDGISTRVRLVDHNDVSQTAITPEVTPGRRAVAAPVRTQGELEGQPVPSAEAHRPAPAVASGPTAPAAAGGADAMTAPMPGVVLSVDVAPGATVARGDLVMVIEAMKMKNEIRASRDGVVAEVPVAAGEQVRYGQVLLRFGAAA